MPARPLLFISDLHLDPERPEPIRQFQRFMAETAVQAEALYILGDFFEAWVGDDELALPFHRDLAETLKGLTQRGVRVYFLPGNRDFLVGDGLAREAGLTLLPDPVVIDVGGTATLLSHGDSFCTDDAAYQAFRTQVREPAWQQAFLAKPLAERRAMARAAREQSEHAKAGKQAEIMDVNQQAVADAFRNHGVTRIIHGHTHRPARHLCEIDGIGRERWVLPDWYESSGYLACDAAGCRALALS